MLCSLHSITSVQETSLLATENAGEKSTGSRNTCLDDQLRTALQTNNSVRNFSAMNPCHFKTSCGKPFRAIVNQHLALIVSKKNWNNGEQK